jgi:hypothetical protein
MARVEQQNAAGNGSSPSLEDAAVLLDELERANAQVAALSASRDALQRQVERLTAEHELWQQQQQQQQHQQHQQEGGPGQGASAFLEEAAMDGVPSPAQTMRQGTSPPAAQAAEWTRGRAELDAALKALRNAEHSASVATSRAEVAESRAARLQAEVERRPTPAQHTEALAALAALSALLGQQFEQEGLASSDAKAAVDALCADPGGLHSALQARVARLTDALTGAGRRADELCSERDGAAARAAAAEQQLAEARAAMRQLEADLASALATGTANGEALLNAASARLPLAAAAGSLPAPLASGASNMPPLAVAAAAAVANVASGGAGAATAAAVAPADSEGGEAAGLLAVVARQRDRLAARAADLEEEVAALKARQGALGARADSLSADNVALVEKIRFLQARQVAGGGSGAAGAAPTVMIRVDTAGVPQSSSAAEGTLKAERFSCGPLAFGFGGGSGGGQRGRRAEARALQQQGGGLEARYAAEYERGINPFAEFRRAELEGRVGALRLHDRVLFAAGQVIAGSPAARAGVVVYLLLLHAFIYVLLMSSSRAAASRAT